MSSLEFPAGFLESLGVLDWGYTEEGKPVSYEHFDRWVSNNLHGELRYLGDHRKELRSDLQNVYPNFKSALVFLFSYHETKKWMLENNHHHVASYSVGFEGEDYHYEIKKRLKKIADYLEVPLEISLDTQPVLERDLAYRAGLGWFGKNSMLIHRKYGSYFLIGSIILNKKLTVNNKKIETDHCGHCKKCAEACPTNAIDVETRTLISNQCISTFTIEIMKEAVPPSGMINSRGEYFGCDICQDVCPWNKRSLRHYLPVLKLKEEFLFLKELFFSFSPQELRKKIESLSNNHFRSFFKGTSFVRTGKKGWLKNFISSRNDS